MHQILAPQARRERPPVQDFLASRWADTFERIGLYARGLLSIQALVAASA